MSLLQEKVNKLKEDCLSSDKLTKALIDLLNNKSITKENIDEYINMGGDIHQTTEVGSLLFLFYNKNRIDLFYYLIDKGVDLSLLKSDCLKFNILINFKQIMSDEILKYYEKFLNNDNFNDDFKSAIISYLISKYNDEIFENLINNYFNLIKYVFTFQIEDEIGEILHYLIRNNKVDKIKELINENKNIINQKLKMTMGSYFLINEICEYGILELVDYLIEHDARYSNNLITSPSYFYFDKNKMKLVEYLIDKYELKITDSNIKEFISFYKICDNNFNKDEYLKNISNSANSVEKFLIFDRGNDLYNYYKWLIELANKFEVFTLNLIIETMIKNNFIDELKLLINNGYINVEHKEYNLIEKIILFCSIDKCEHIEYLIKLGVSINQKTNNGLPISVACKQNDLKLVDYLITKGSVINTYDKHAPILIAIKNGNYKMVKLLLQYKQLDLFIEDDGDNLLELSMEKNELIYKLLYKIYDKLIENDYNEFIANRY